MSTVPKAQLPDGVSSKYVQVDGLLTHYLEAGIGFSETVLLIHSGEFGGRAEFSWRYNIAELGRHFHVYAPDMTGFGRTALVYNFSDPVGFRLNHLSRFLEMLCVGPVHLIGNSFGGGVVLQMALDERFTTSSVIVVSGGGKAPDNDERKVLTQYNGTRDEMQAILRVCFYDEKWWSDAEVEERWRASREPGVWEACAVSRLAPEGQSRGFRPLRPDYGRIKCPVLIVAGAQDPLRFPTYATDLQGEIEGSQVKVFDQSRHCSHIEHAEAFNTLATDFITHHSGASSK